MKVRNFTGIILIFFWFLPVQSQVHLSEGFEDGVRPAGWTEEYVQPPVHTEPWRYRNGGHSPNDINWYVAPDADDPTRNPPSAYDGTYNAIFFVQGDDNQRTKLITPPMDLEGGTNVELSFYLCQIPWTFVGYTGWDVLRVYYKVSEGSPWVLLHEYLDPVYDWELQTLVLPNLSSTYYIAFEGQTRWGYGTCIDNVVVEEKGTAEYWIGDLQFNQPFTGLVPSGSTDVPLMRVDFKIFGNTGSAELDNIEFTSLNTSDADIVNGSVRLYSTLSQTFSRTDPVGTATSFVSGKATFTGLNHPLPHGLSYLWLAADIDPNASTGDILDVKLEANSLLANDTLYPATPVSPSGQRVITETKYSELFEGVHNWTLTGEFEVATPLGLGGSPGNPDPAEANSGSKVLGTDLLGHNENPYNYEPSVPENSPYLATSPTINMYYYKDIHLFFQRYLNIEVWDKAYVQVSKDDGASWYTLWENNGYINDFEWTAQDLAVPAEYARSRYFKIRYQLGPTDSVNNYSGWNIDDVFLTGTFISKDVGISEWIYPLSGCGHTASDSVVVRIENYGGAAVTDPIPVSYSFDGGSTWTTDICDTDIPVDGSVLYSFPTRADLSAPGLRPQVLAKTGLVGDQEPNNDQLATQLFIVPTYEPPYQEDFEGNDGYWHMTEGNVWEHGVPAGSVINTAASGSKVWATGLDQTYGSLISDTDSTIFFDDFESESGWDLSGEFERAIPVGAPYFSFAGLYCVGTDLTGMGLLYYAYEKGIDENNAYRAVSPAFDVSAYGNLKVSFYRFLNILQGDSVSVEVSPDNGVTWYLLWKNTEGEIMDYDWYLAEYLIPDSLSYSTQMKIRLSLFYSGSGGDPAAGLTFDNFRVSGDLADLIPHSLVTSCFDLSGLDHPLFDAKIWIDTELGVDGASLYYTVDRGTTWIPVSNSSVYDDYWNWYTGDPVLSQGTDGWSGQSGGWIRVRHLLPAACTLYDCVQFKVLFTTDKLDNQHDGIAIDDVRIYEAPDDIGIIDIINPVTACELSANQTFTLSLKNFGVSSLVAGDSIRIGYHIDKSGDIQSSEETIHLAQTFTAGSTKNFNLSTEFDFSESGEYQVDVFVIEPDPVFYTSVSNDTISRLIRVNKPFVDLGPDISTVRPDTVFLNAYSGVPGYGYEWKDYPAGSVLSSDSVYQVSTQGTYTVTVTNDLFCSAYDTVQILQLIADVGVSELVAPLSACELGDQVPIDIRIENFGTDTVDVLDTIFVYGQINQSIFFSDTIWPNQAFHPGDVMDFSYTDLFDFSVPGTYQLKLYTRLRDDFTNINDTVKYTLEVYGYPDIDLGPDTVVPAASYLLAPTTGYFEYLWQDGSQEESFLVDQPGQDWYKVTVNDVHGCTTVDSVHVTLNVKDLELTQILSPETSCGLSETITVSARITNAGNLTIPSSETITLGYSVDGGPPVEEDVPLTEDFLPGASIDYVFTQTTNVVTGTWYDFTVYGSYAEDMKSWNDTIVMPVGVFATPVVDLGESYQVITATEYVLDAGPGFSTYEWQDGSTGQTFTVTEPGIGVYGVTVTDGNGCPAYDEVQIMLAVPDVSVQDVLYPLTTCSLGTGEHIQLAVRNTGNWDIDPSAVITVGYSVNGSPPVNENLSLTQTFENGTVINHSFAAAEDFSTPGPYEIVATVSYGSDLIPGNDTLVFDMEVYGNPVVDISGGQDTLLVYDPVTLSADPGFVSYEWQDGSTDPDYLISDPGTGMYRVLVTDVNGCTASDSIFVVHDVPDLSVTSIVSPVSACSLGASETVSFEILNNGFYRIPTSESMSISYTLDGGDPVIEVMNLASTLQPGASRVIEFVTPADLSATGSYQLAVNLAYAPDENLVNNDLSTEVNVWGYPSIDIGSGEDTLTISLPVTLDAGTGYSSYLWQDNSNGTTFEVVQAGWYWVEVGNEHACTSRDSLYVQSPVSVEDLLFGKDQVMIWPNPAEDVLHVLVESAIQKDYSLELYSIQNTLVYREDLKPTSRAEWELNVQDLAPGTYFLRIRAGQMPKTWLVVIR